MKRKIIKIDTEKCNGCGLCAQACHEGAIQIVNQKAKLLRDDYCDGLGDCLPSCPVDAISFDEREALPYDERAVQRRLQQIELGKIQKELAHNEASALQQWPIQMKLMPLQASYFEQADLLIAADCCAFAYAAFHKQFMKKKTTMIGCPKLDMIDYSEKLTAIFKQNRIRSIQIVRMEVPCCKGMESAVLRAIQNYGKKIPCKVVIISKNGNIL